MLKFILRILYLPFLLVKIIVLLALTIIWFVPIGLLGVMFRQQDIDDLDDKIKEFWGDCFN